MPTADAAQIDRAFHALADESRRAMVVRLSRGAASVSECVERPVELCGVCGRHGPHRSAHLGS